MTRRWVDHEGHAWPITGHVCAACGLPLIRAHYGQTTHPNCAEEATQ